MSFKIDKIIRQKRKTLSIQVLDNGKLLIKVPKNIDDKQVFNFIEKHKNWINKRLLLLSNRNELKNKIEHQGKTLLMGKQLAIEHSSFVTKPVLVGQKILLNCQNIETSKILLENWYKKIALEHYEKRVFSFSKLMGLKYNKVKLSAAIRRWGSCSSKGNINLNWRLIMAPEFIIDYVIVHELAHLREMNHSQRFWNEVGRFVPDFKARRKWLKENGFLLSID